MGLSPITLPELTHWLQPDQSLNMERFFMAAAPDFPLRLQNNFSLQDITPEQIVQLSGLFLSERTERIGKLLPQENEATSPTKFLFLPIRSPVAMLDHVGNESYCIFSLGLFELIQYQATISIWQSLVRPRLKGLDLETKNITLVEGFLNLRSVLFLLGETPLLQVGKHLSQKIIQRGHVIAEVATTFLIQHEIGHSVFRASEEISDEKEINLIKHEILTPNKKEEFFADWYSLQQFPRDGQATVLEAATVVFNLMTYIDSIGEQPDPRHPLTLNRLHYLAEKICKHSGKDANTSLSRAIDHITDISEQVNCDVAGANKNSRESLLRANQKLEKSINWSTILKASSILVDSSC